MKARSGVDARPPPGPPTPARVSQPVRRLRTSPLGDRGSGGGAPGGVERGGAPGDGSGRGGGGEKRSCVRRPTGTPGPRPRSWRQPPAPPPAS
ncbi:hypothetical protein FNV66_26770 [Streptomyces sp. S1D4-14]|nr:hypothetical protein FNV67_27580 [Streptomyces sp. S1D4-20]QDN68679.1 hypothetical protein FNV66_26770 [Streptomyces sp. S1D4-14]QDO51097.1 hypothetical protein FNV60_25035 [Streptomyces sp. RLB3-5]QDO61336.1 hypothetical protein FNV59_27275 [Streptomyces sp. RLB1-8]